MKISEFLVSLEMLDALETRGPHPGPAATSGSWGAAVP